MMRFLDQASQSLAGIQKKTVDTINVHKLRARAKAVEEEIRKVYASIGEICYDAHRLGTEPADLDMLYANVDQLKLKLAELHAGIEQLGGMTRCPACGAAVERDGNFCPQCGVKLTERRNDLE